MPRLCTLPQLAIGPGQPLAIIAGPCLLESRELGLHVASTLRDACRAHNLPFIFKASFDKANRTSVDSPRGPGIELGLRWLADIRQQLAVPITTDVHEPAHCLPAARVADILQIPAFLARQSDLLFAAGAAVVDPSTTAQAVNVKKGQFMAPAEMTGPAQKLASVRSDNTLFTERGTFFGYGRLVNDFIGVAELIRLPMPAHNPALHNLPIPVCFDATHSTQRPAAGEGGRVTGGSRDMAPILARAAVAAGVHAIFLECHPDPDRALSDAATQLHLHAVPALLAELAAIRAAVTPPRAEAAPHAASS